jgi:hypothetical protein
MGRESSIYQMLYRITMVNEADDKDSMNRTHSLLVKIRASHRLLTLHFQIEEEGESKKSSPSTFKVIWLISHFAEGGGACSRCYPCSDS